MRNNATTLNVTRNTSRRMISRRRPLERKGQISQPQANSVVEPLALRASRLPDMIESRLIDLECGNFSKRTIEKNQIFLDRYQWYITKFRHEFCDKDSIRGFFLYLRRSHEEPNGRWDNGRPAEPLRPSYIETYYRVLQAFFTHLIKEGHITESPMGAIPKPKVPPDEIPALSAEQVAGLISAATKTSCAARDEAIVKLLYDTGIRAQELCSLKIQDMDVRERSLRILGKGNKFRKVFMDPSVCKAITDYLRERGGLSNLEGDEYIFLSLRGGSTGLPLTPNGLSRLFRRLGQHAGIRNVRCSPHVLRHSFATETLRNGRGAYLVQQALGHTTMTMTKKYIWLSDADQRAQHRTASPVAALRNTKRGQ